MSNQPTNKVEYADDASVVSRDSTGAVSKMLKESIELDDDTVFEFKNDTHFADSLDDLVDPLGDIENDELGKEQTPRHRHPWQEVFEPEVELPHLQRMIPISISQDSSSSSSTLDTTAVSLDDDEISFLMTGAILEPRVPSRVSVGGEWDTVCLSSTTEAPPPPTQVQIALPGEADVIHRILGYLHHTESNQQVFLEAQKIVQECHFHHHNGNRRYKNLPGSIFERLVGLLGGTKFQEIYQHVQSLDPRSHYHPRETAYAGPSILELGIAYGIHLARTNARSEPRLGLIQHGAASLHSMSGEERVMFWNYMTGGGA